MEVEHGLRDDASPLESLAQSDPHRLGVTPRPGQFAADAVPESLLLLDDEHTKTRTCQHAPKRCPASPPPAITTSKFWATMTQSTRLPDRSQHAVRLPTPPSKPVGVLTTHAATRAAAWSA